MRLQVYQPPDAGALWRVGSFGRQVAPAGRPFWWDNRNRVPADQVIIQGTFAGSIVLHERGQEHTVGPGQLLIFQYGEPTAYGRQEPLREPFRTAWVGLRGAGVTEHLTAFRQRHGSVRDLGLDSPLLVELDALISLAEPQAGTPPTELAVAAFTFVMHLFEHAERGRMQTLSPVEQAIESILRQPHAPLSLEQIAAKFGCSREHLSRSFQERVGSPPVAYLAEARRRRALRLLQETDLPLAAVAEQSGYATVHTLARHVREATGASPTELRTRRRGRGEEVDAAP